jgi:hypothetical protein
MKKALAFAGAAAVLALALSLAFAHPDSGARPDGVPGSAWIPLTDDAGFVVTGSISQMTSPGAAPSVRGYLMARRDGRWVRLDPEGGARLVPTN